MNYNNTAFPRDSEHSTQGLTKLEYIATNIHLSEQEAKLIKNETTSIEEACKFEAFIRVIKAKSILNECDKSNIS